MELVAEMTFWCKRENESAFLFTIKVGKPEKVDDETWQCEWSLGKILPHEGAKIKNISSLLSLLTTIHFLGKYLKGREELGDKFYLDEDLTEPIPSMEDLFFYMCKNNESDENYRA